MEKFGLFDLIDKLSAPLGAKNSTPQLAQNVGTNTQTIAKSNKQSAKNSARLFILKHEELSRKIDSATKK